MRSTLRLLLVIALCISLSGCLGTFVRAPGSTGRTHEATRAHLILMPATIDAGACENGMTQVAVFVPLWGVAVAILTLGILVPQKTEFTCRGS